MDDIFITHDLEIDLKIQEILSNRMGIQSTKVVEICDDIIEYGIRMGNEMTQLFGYYFKVEVFMRAELVYDKNLIQEWINKGILLSEQNNQMEYLIKFYNLRGSFFSWFDDYVSAIETYKLAVQLCDQHGFLEIRGKLIANIAIIYTLIEDDEEAIEYLLEAENAPVDADVELNLWNKVLQLYYLAGSYLRLDEVEMAYMSQTDIENLIQGRPNNSYYRFGVLVLFGRIAMKRGRLDQVKYYIDQIIHSEERIHYIGISDGDAVHYIHLLCEYEKLSKEEMDNEVGSVLEKMKETYEIDEPTIHQRKNFLQELMMFYEKTDQFNLYKATAKQFLTILEDKAFDDGKHLLDIVEIRSEIKKMKLNQFKESYRTRELKHQTQHDDLTQLLNRRGLEYFADKWMDYAYQGKKVFVVGMIDIDSFKKLNDEHGHLHGDRCLAILGKVLEGKQSEHILAARVGGDEFVVIFWDVEFQEVDDFAKELKREMLKIEGGIHLSQGYAARVPQEQMKPWDYLNRADTMLYEMKQTSGNNYKIYWEN